MRGTLIDTRHAAQINLAVISHNAVASLSCFSFQRSGGAKGRGFAMMCQGQQQLAAQPAGLLREVAL